MANWVAAAARPPTRPTVQMTKSIPIEDLRQTLTQARLNADTGGNTQRKILVKNPTKTLTTTCHRAPMETITRPAHHSRSKQPIFPLCFWAALFLSPTAVAAPDSDLDSYTSCLLPRSCHVTNTFWVSPFHYSTRSLRPPRLLLSSASRRCSMFLVTSLTHLHAHPHPQR